MPLSPHVNEFIQSCRTVRMFLVECTGFPDDSKEKELLTEVPRIYRVPEDRLVHLMEMGDREGLRDDILHNVRIIELDVETFLRSSDDPFVIEEQPDLNRVKLIVFKDLDLREVGIMQEIVFVDERKIGD